MGLGSGSGTSINTTAGTDAAAQQIQAAQAADAAFNYYAGLQQNVYNQYQPAITNTLLGQYYGAQNQATQATNTGLAGFAPYTLAGDNALDLYQQSLGLATPTGGSFGLQQAIQQGQLAQTQEAALKNIYSELVDQYNLPTSQVPMTGNYATDLATIQNQFGNLQSAVAHGGENTPAAALQQLANQAALSGNPTAPAPQPSYWNYQTGPQQGFPQPSGSSSGTSTSSGTLNPSAVKSNFSYLLNPGSSQTQTTQPPSPTTTPQSGIQAWAQQNIPNLAQYSNYLGGPQAAAAAPQSVLNALSAQGAGFTPYSTQQEQSLQSLSAEIQNQLAQLQPVNLSPAQQQLYQQYQSGNVPTTAANTANVMQQFQQANPGYQFALQQGQNAVTNSAAAQGLLNSSQFARSLDQYSQGLANQTYTQWQQQLAALAGQGQSATGNVASGQEQLGSNLSNLSATLGNNLSSAYTGLANNISGIIGNQGSTAANSLLAQGGAASSGILNNANLGLAQANLNMANQSSNAGLLGTLGSGLGPSLFGSGTAGSGLLGLGLGTAQSSSIGGALGGLAGLAGL